MEWVFWISIGLVAYSYAGYPVLLAIAGWLLPGTRNKVSPSAGGVSADAALPTVTIIIPAHNEEASIGPKLQSCLQLDYPKDRLEVVVFSDGSTDGTNEQVRPFLSPRLRLVFHPQRRGKMQVLNEAVSSVFSEIVVLSDAEGKEQKAEAASVASAEPTGAEEPTGDDES